MQPAFDKDQKASRAWMSSIFGFFSVIAALVAISFVLALLWSVAPRTFNVPASSMSPTLEIGDFFLAWLYDPRDLGEEGGSGLLQGWVSGRPARGHVIVFKAHGGVFYVKRIVGLPGERIRMVKGRLLIDGVAVQRDLLPAARGQKAGASLYRETLPGGASHQIVEMDGDRGFLDDTEEFLVPAGHFFVLGDNRDNSADSRVSPEQNGVGFVPFAAVGRRAMHIYFSSPPEDGDASASGFARAGKIE